MNTVPYVDANAKDYWPHVRANARKRNGLEIARVGFKNLRPGMIYEQYVADCLDVIRNAARQVQLKPDEYEDFKRECAALFVMPELSETSEEDIYNYRQQAVREARELLYGDEA